MQVVGQWKVWQYINYALQTPRPRPEWVAFLQSSAWLMNVRHSLENADAVFDAQGLTVATYAIYQSQASITATSDPWVLNPLYCNQTCMSGSSRASLNLPTSGSTASGHGNRWFPPQTLSSCRTLAKGTGQSFDLVLTRFALERLLFRLGQSPHADRFALKGEMLMMSWFDDPHRGTRDLDLLGSSNPEPAPMMETFREILAHKADDADTLRVDRIREGLDYGGLRLRMLASVSRARINLTVDIGFGDGLVLGRERIRQLFAIPGLTCWHRS